MHCHVPRGRRSRGLGSIMLKGSKPAVVKKIQPVSIHGQISLDVYVFDPDVPRNLEPGDPVELHYMLGVVTQITRRP